MRPEVTRIKKRKKQIKESITQLMGRDSANGNLPYKLLEIGAPARPYVEDAL